MNVKRTPDRVKMFLQELYEILSKEKILSPYKISQTSNGKMYISITNYMGKTIMSLYRTVTKQPSLMCLLFDGIGYKEGYPVNEHNAFRRLNYTGERIGDGLCAILTELKLDVLQKEIRKDCISNNLLMLYKSYEHLSNERYLIKKIALSIGNVREIKEMI